MSIRSAENPHKAIRSITLKMYNVIPNMVCYTYIENGLRLPILRKPVKLIFGASYLHRGCYLGIREKGKRREKRNFVSDTQ